MQLWEMFSIIGTVSFALQGGLIAMENKYDFFAVYLFGLITSFGGGALRHIVLGEATYDLWNQERLFWVAMVCITLIILFPQFFLKSKRIWANVLDAIGVIAFAIQGSIQAVNMELPASAVVVAALITATGGGVFRDLLSQRRPILLGEEIYSLWIFLVGLIIGLGWAPANVHLLLLFIVFTTLRILSYFNHWIIPYRRY